MTEIEKNTKALESCDCESIKKELEITKADLEKANEIIKQYEEAYKELQTKFNRLYSILGNQIEYSLNIK